MISGKPFNQHCRGPNVDGHVGVELIRAEPADLVHSEPGSIVHQQSDRRQPDGTSEYSFSAIDRCKIRNDLGGTLRNIIAIMVDVGEHRPAVGDQRGGDRGAHALAGASHDCCPVRCHRQRSCLEWRVEAIQ
jgi:hypothetical protein